MRILIVYASTDGQTRKVARFAFDQISDAGHSVALIHASDANPMDLSRIDGAILAGSVHAGSYQSELGEFAEAHATALNRMPTLFLGVSLCAAGDDAEDWKDLNASTQRFFDDAGWTSGRVEHIAGAYRFTEYNFFESWAMRWIAAQKGQEVDPHENKEFTDWDALKTCLANWLEGVARQD